LRVITTTEELRHTILAHVTTLQEPESRRRRAARLAVQGTLTARPALRAEIAKLEIAFQTEMASAIAEVQDRGLVRAGIDPLAYASWWMGTLAGLAVLDLGLSAASSEQWTDLVVRMITEVALGQPLEAASEPAWPMSTR
jgi:hypothetical protein